MSNLLGGTSISKTSVFFYFLIFNYNATNEIHQNSRNLGHQWKDCNLRIKKFRLGEKKAFLFLAPKNVAQRENMFRMNFNYFTCITYDRLR